MIFSRNSHFQNKIASSPMQIILIILLNTKASDIEGYLSINLFNGMFCEIIMAVFLIHLQKNSSHKRGINPAYDGRALKSKNLSPKNTG